MGRVQNVALTITLLALAISSTALAHGDDEPSSASGMDMAGDHMNMAVSGVPIAASVDEFDYNPSYFHYPEHAGLVYSHIILSLVSWVLALPLAVMLSIARSHFAVLAQTAFLVFNGLAILTGTIYNSATPDLYENNAHHKIGWVITWIALGWSIMGIVIGLAGGRNSKAGKEPLLQPVSSQAMAEYQRMHDLRKIEDYRWSHDSGHATERNTESLCSSSRTSSLNSQPPTLPIHQAYGPGDDEAEEEDTEAEKQEFLGTWTIDRALTRFLPRLNPGKGLFAAQVVYTMLERFMIVLGFIAITTGIVTYGGIFHNNEVFNGAAHFVKGGIFVWYGILTFGRWMGCFADLGWAWNIKPEADLVGPTRAWIPSAEFTESFVIWLYGASNVFMEHMGSRENGRWTPTDLEHLSITILFFGGGLLGMLIDSPRMRQLVNTGLYNNGVRRSFSPGSDRWQTPKSSVHSLNPMPALTIMLMGIMMSGHTQDSMVSTMLHKQWGQLFTGFAIMRGLTYITLWLKPPKSYLPSRPPTEIIASFCLISGGLIFMSSNRDTVASLEHYGLHAMLVWTLVMGFVALFMAWEIVLIAIKNWAASTKSWQYSPLISQSLEEAA